MRQGLVYNFCLETKVSKPQHTRSRVGLVLPMLEAALSLAHGPEAYTAHAVDKSVKLGAGAYVSGLSYLKVGGQDVGLSDIELKELE